MTTNIVLRAEDPARAAAIARALGIPLRDPDRANPDCWHVRTFITILVTAAGGRPGLSFVPEGHGQFSATVAHLAEAVGEAGAAVADDGSVAIAEAFGLEIRVESDGPRLITRDPHDVGRLFTVKPIFDRHRDVILAMLQQVGASDPRLVGPALGRLSESRRWLLVVDAAEEANLGSIEELIGTLGAGFAPVDVRRSDAFDPEHLAEIDRLAFDI